MEFLLVTYPGERDVYVDGQMVGKTNRILPSMLMPGMYEVNLGAPQNYAPASVPVMLHQTTIAAPCVVEFVAAGYRAAPPANKPYVFVAMDFDPRFETRFVDAIFPAAKAAGFPAVRTDRIAYTGNVVTHLLSQIDNAWLLIADLFPENPNVYLEVGYGWARNKPLVLLVNRAGKRSMDVPFDLRQQRYLEYQSTEQLKDILQQELIGIRDRPG